MQINLCPNCGKLTGFKRSLGIGTIIMVLITSGIWLLLIPFYPVRCINCGLTRGTARNMKNASSSYKAGYFLGKAIHWVLFTKWG
jgi:ribosomal protein S14